MRRWGIVIMLLVLAWQALADGKAFPMVADPLADVASSTMPRQRAIIAWDGTEQRMAIDTAFTGEGTEFAWLVPLPSEPEILPATKGMFDTAAVLTAPRIEQHDAGWVMVLGAVLVLAAFGAMTLKSAIAKITLLVVMLTLALFAWLPAMGTARGSAFPPSTVEVLSTGTAGIYDTAVVRAKGADELIEWLTTGGYSVPPGVGIVVQDYLDRGWVFATAKLSIEDAEAAEHRAHPLQFRFEADAPVYPMALTAVGNTEIELELFVFADGTAAGEGLRAACSLETQPDTRDAAGLNTWRMVGRRPITIAHPGLADIATGLPDLTRLTGVLSPDEQRKDITLSIEPFEEHDPGFYMPGTGIARSVGVGLIVAGTVGLVFAMFVVDASQVRAVLARQQGRAVGAMAAAGVVVGAGVAMATPVYRGEISNWRPAYEAEAAMRSLGEHLPLFAADREPTDEQEVLTLFEGFAPQETLDALREGDSPLHYRLEPGDTDASLWFIWHDAIGGEHRSLVPLVEREPLGAIRFDDTIRQDLERFDGDAVRTFVHEVDLGQGVLVPVDVAFTSKGNGMLSCLNLHERVYDAHDDGVLYAGGFAAVVFVDTNRDGYRDLVIASALLESPDDRAPSTAFREYAQSIYLYQPELRDFSADLMR